tara:strand:- start:718 stop:1029 length:312 start_codon:yes stop_codon:yes gene_type:complete
MSMTKERIREIVEEEVKSFSEQAPAAPGGDVAPEAPRQKSDVEKATGKMQDVSSLQAYIAKIDTPQEMEQFLGNVVKMASQKMSKPQVLASLTKLISFLRKEQ